VEYEDAGREGLRESTGEILGLMPFGCWGEEDADMEFWDGDCPKFGEVFWCRKSENRTERNWTNNQQDFHMSRDQYQPTQYL